MKAFAIGIVLTLSTSGAFACASDNYDREQELQLIKSELAKTKSGDPRGTQVRELLEKASVDPKSLTIKGLRMQSGHRGEAIKLLGLNRIPSKPERELAAVDAALSSPAQPAENKAAAAALRADYEKLWAEQKYTQANAAIFAAVKRLNISISYPRC